MKPEQLARYERGLGISACTPSPHQARHPVLTGVRAQESPVTSFSRGCRVIGDAFAVLVIFCVLCAPIVILAAIIICLFGA